MFAKPLVFSIIAEIVLSQCPLWNGSQAATGSGLGAGRRDPSGQVAGEGGVMHLLHVLQHLGPRVLQQVRLTLERQHPDDQQDRTVCRRMEPHPDTAAGKAGAVVWYNYK